MRLEEVWRLRELKGVEGDPGDDIMYLFQPDMVVHIDYSMLMNGMDLDHLPGHDGFCDMPDAR